MAKEPRDYTAMVGQAEKAVAAVKDPELKRIAYEKVLDRLLAESDAKGSASEAKPAGGKPAARAAKPAARRKGGPAAYLSELVEEGFFKKPTTITQVKAELENRGHHIPLTSLSGPLQKKCQARILRRQRIKAAGKKQTYAYSNW